MLIEQLSGCDAASAGTLTCGEPTTNPDSSVTMSATLKMVVKEDMYARETAPAAFNKEREAVNEAANTAMKPESVYLFQVGATTDLITDAKHIRGDRRACLGVQELFFPLFHLIRFYII